MASWYNRVILPRLLNSEMGSEELEKTRREVLRSATGTVLEIGVGPGYNLPLYRNITKLYALEPSKELLEIAKEHADTLPFPIEFLNTGAERIPLPDHSIDTVISTWTLCSVNEPKEVLAEIKRVLAPGGRFVFAEHGASRNPVWHIFQTAFTAVSKHFTGNCHYDRNIEKHLHDAGFTLSTLEESPERLKPLIYNYQGVAVPGRHSSPVQVR